MKKRGKVIALLLVVAIIFGIWKNPIKSYADKKQIKNIKQETIQENNVEEIEIPEEVIDSFIIEDENNSYFEYKITQTDIYCVHYEYIGQDENDNPMYNKKVTKSTIFDNIQVNDIETQEETMGYRAGTELQTGSGPLYWQKNVSDKLKKEYYYQLGVKGQDVYYRIGGQNSFAVNYSTLSESAALDVDAFVEQIDLVNKQLHQCIIVAIGTVMLAISAIIASYISVGAAQCLKLIAPLLEKFGVTLIKLSPINFGKMVFEMYDNYRELDKLFCRAAVHGSIFTP